METGTLEKKIAKLPENLKLKVEGYIDALLSDKASQNISNNNLKVEKGFGGGKELIAYMADDFDAPLDEQKPKLKREFDSLKGFVTYMAG
jgi:hypothetical protein